MASVKQRIEALMDWIEFINKDQPKKVKKKERTLNTIRHEKEHKK